MVSAAVAFLPTAVSLLLLVALFMQISGVSLALPWTRRLCCSEFSCAGASATGFPLSKHTGKGDIAPALSGLHVYLQFMWEVGLPPSPVKFSSHCHFYRLSCSWLLGGAAAPASCHVCLQFTWEVGLSSSPVEFSSLHHSHQLPRSWLLGARPAPSRASPAPTPACSFTVPGRIPFPQSSVLRAPLPLSRVSLLLLLLITQFLFFPPVEVGLSRGLCCSGPGLSMGVLQYREAHLVRVFPSRLGASDSSWILEAKAFDKWRVNVAAMLLTGSDCRFDFLNLSVDVSNIFLVTTKIHLI
jgi:hypothetical protein